MLKKRRALNEAFDFFDPEKVAAYDGARVAALLANPAIIRNRKKIEAMIKNADVILKMRASHQGFAGWLAAHHPRDKAVWVKLFRSTFFFTGGEITHEFLMSIGLLPGAHGPDCPITAFLVTQKPF